MSAIPGWRLRALVIVAFSLLAADCRKQTLDTSTPASARALSGSLPAIDPAQLQ